MSDTHMSDKKTELTELILEKIRFGAQQIFSRAMLEDIEVSVLEDHFSSALVAQLTTLVLADRLAPAKHVEQVAFPRPASLWQHIKLVCFPTFSRLLHRPPRLTYDYVDVEIKVQNFALFPEPTIVYPKELGRFVRYQQTDARQKRLTTSPFDKA